MRPNVLPVNWQSDPVLLKRIHSGGEAERSFIKKNKKAAFLLLSTKHGIPKREAPGMIRRALIAAIGAIRYRGEWKPNLVERQLYDQVTVYRFQNRLIPETLLRRYQQVAIRYIRKHMGWWRVAGGLTLKQEAVYEAAMEAFFTNIRLPGFKLTAALSTYLLAIAKNMIYASGRQSGSAKLPGYVDPEVREAFVSPQTVRYYQQAHRLIASQIGQMGTTCQQLIYSYYGIDPWRVDAVIEQPDVNEALPEQEFRERFSVAISGAEPAPTLRQVAENISISPKKISERHLACIDRLVSSVIPALLNDPALNVPEAYQQLLQSRLTKGRSGRR